MTDDPGYVCYELRSKNCAALLFYGLPQRPFARRKPRRVERQKKEIKCFRKRRN